MIVSRNSKEAQGLVPIFKTNTTWSKVRSSDLRLIQSDTSTSHQIVTKIQKLVQKLAEFPQVKRVRAIALKYPDLHNIDFEVELLPEVELSYQSWEQLQEIVIDCEWKLRDNSGEKWYFHSEVVNQLSPVRDTTKVIVDSHNRPQVGIQTWSSPSLKLVNHQSLLATF
ncbi:hypothetical protein [Anabaena sp. 4-3]|uniref:hypothetical protein n=1 Tax=Anabaena sp. 4-3 TaxID=1811979 RepID=UPI000830AB3B|nr:hypothetical protein [Anabaena sp. 4-3]